MVRQVLAAISIFWLQICFAQQSFEGQITKLPTPTVGNVFRIQLMLSPGFVEHFGDDREQERIRNIVNKRFDFRSSDYRTISEKVTPKTTEGEAERLFAQLKTKLNRRIETTHEELEITIGEQQFEKVLRVQIGLVGPQSLLDSRIADYLKFGEPDVQRIRAFLSTPLESQHATNPEQHQPVATETVETKVINSFAIARSHLSLEQWSAVTQAAKDCDEFLSKLEEQIQRSIVEGMSRLEPEAKPIPNQDFLGNKDDQ